MCESPEPIPCADLNNTQMQLWTIKSITLNLFMSTGTLKCQINLSVFMGYARELGM